MADESHEITQLLFAWSQGDGKAEERLMGLVYEELHRMAARYFRDERPGHTLQTTALVHDAYLRLVGHDRLDWESRSQFFGLAARTMRRILVDHARARNSQKRGGDAVRLPFEEVENLCHGRSEELIALDEALAALARLDARKAKIVELRYFGGFEVQEIAGLLAVSVPTVNRHWRTARAWLAAELRKRD